MLVVLPSGTPKQLSPELVLHPRVLKMSESVKEAMERSREDCEREERGADEEEERRLQEACGVIGCVLARNTSDGTVNVAKMIYLGLVALQHR